MNALADVDEDPLRLKRLVADLNRVATGKAGVAAIDGDVLRRIEPFLEALIRAPDNGILALLDLLHVDADGPIDEYAEVRCSPGDVGGARARDHRLRRRAARVDTGSAKQLAFDDRCFEAFLCKARRQRRARLGRADHNGVVSFRHADLPYAPCPTRATARSWPFSTFFSCAYPRSSTVPARHQLNL